VPQSGYSAFARGLARIGSWQPDAEPADLPAHVHVTLRLVYRADAPEGSTSSK
jgi:hypothetical protein